MKVIDLGWCMARINEKEKTITIVSPSDADNFYMPASSVSVYGIHYLNTLRNALNEMLKEVI